MHTYKNFKQKLTTTKETLENQLSSGDISGEEIKELSINLKEINSSIDKKEERWLELSLKIEG